MTEQFEKLSDFVLNKLDDEKATDILPIDVRDLTTITDKMVICTGRSTRHVKAVAKNLVNALKENFNETIYTEGEQNAEWVLVDIGSIIVHIMLQETRTFYNLEGLWCSPDIKEEKA